ncbi:UDP-N-acetylglucosamine--N-acetylmuramyl-(pentapeptide) pyrophosphoryl-undecaprenol N-acetylglucosamine transferase [Syntrophobotulus glycolicus DSM 8271]|uniref:UDP-N-acetylglucosamine--N-acetylmuramyl-(pentapeptide) pyrophosphoryl-undecaprenol N-acetylglucosamine transferase n=1 Tax=Syntrophobotulus glycolicus (strain DSM 8271 / FlGlyR) TaxID=645991 RepID=F0SZZ9_SYNGF|nr:undecaprenyldiphospho-muramoylpentapeptide beta-N-acetylglucosaminyltransferase [Syntrophobotulus glycolicus]ADY55010.1 UDP-N-acetylglucosamine--N-acetylmuramyl-(pentapeptide) pyrophosphoryl-undecaprenol N-acetylglucosamine transferase [Syntrophobotulus glycolicus DSM 8271]
MRVIVTGGGTGGHIYPALAVAEGLKDKIPEVKILYVGNKDGMEARIVPENGTDFKGISGRGLPRRLSPDMLKAGGSNLKALWQAKQILKEFQPDLVVGTGGYVSGPVVFVAALFGIPAILHEQNALAGVTNKMLGRVVKKILLTFEESRKYFSHQEKIDVVGLPVRKEIGSISRQAGAAALGIDPAKRTLLVTGGSRGALNINKAMLEVAEKLRTREDIQLIWATGTATYEEISKELEIRQIDRRRRGWRMTSYIRNMPEALACSDLCICRAGAGTLAELSAAGRASILIPYPYAAENHQEHNARAFADKGAAVVIKDNELSGTLLWEQIEAILSNRFKFEEMGARARGVFPAGALSRIVEYCRETAWK